MDIDGWFQLTAARRRLGIINGNGQFDGMVSTHSRPKAAGQSCHPTLGNTQSVSTHSRPKAAGSHPPCRSPASPVSTHSRPKAAGESTQPPTSHSSGFNSQPPEGGWGRGAQNPAQGSRFNSQPPEGGWLYGLGAGVYPNRVSTHSRPKAAGRGRHTAHYRARRFNSQPPEGGWGAAGYAPGMVCRFNSQPPEGGWWWI